MASIPPPPRAIGPYLLEELLGRGGMAEVYRARREGSGGFEKVFALKRILPLYARNPTLIQRFESEAKIAGGLDHGNVVHVVDFGEADGEHYLVMEWVDGVPLSTLLRTVAERGRHLPPEVVAHVLSEAAQGLHYAHTRTDATGRPLSIVHRDVSPQNILLARQGDVKITDFGIAKAADSVVRTEAGIQVGKLCYMAPEQAKGEPLDARADVYALGIVLWECLAMRPLFPRDDGGEALRAVIEPKHVAPSVACPTATAALDAVVLKALAPDREARYPDAGALARDLRVYVHSIAPGFGNAELAQYLQETLPFAGGAARVSAPPQPAPAPAPAAPTAWPKPAPAAAIPATAPPHPVAVPRAVGAGGGSRMVLVLSAVAGLVLLGAASAVFVLVRSEQPLPSGTLTGGGVSPAAPNPTPAPTPQIPYAPLSPGIVTPATPGQTPTTIPSSDAQKVTLHLQTEPAGATIVMEGEAVGVTPMEVRVQAQRPLRMALLLRGHEPVLFPGPPEDFPQLLALAAGLQAPIVLPTTTDTFGLVEVTAAAVGSAHVIVDGIDSGEEPVLVQIRFARGVPTTRVELEVPGQGRTPIDLTAVAVPWDLRVHRH